MNNHCRRHHSTASTMAVAHGRSLITESALSGKKWDLPALCSNPFQHFVESKPSDKVYVGRCVLEVSWLGHCSSLVPQW